MNIFYLDKNVTTCAEYHCDKHVIKMILEYTQLLCSAHWMNGKQAPYKLTHKNHPCSIWVRSSNNNYSYLLYLLFELHIQYLKRYNKIHKSMEHIQFLDMYRPSLPDIPFVEPPKCIPEEYKVDDVIESYRNYYKKDKVRFAKWKNSEVPSWMYDK
jgi:hypothetical protein